ncbi:MAG: O-antigen ligase family protein [Oscillospiraceae bacterium]|nr:O-antigen ligase family protein [Oscillospiraceae bacterium]
MEHKILAKAKGFYFMVVAVMMYYFLNEYIDVGLHVTFRHAFALVLFASAAALFLYKPNIARGVTVFGEACVYSTPLLVTTVVSLFIWFTGTVDTGVISRGLSGSFIYVNMLSFALGAGALLYVFGSRGVWYNLIAILLANLLMIATVIAENGLGAYFSEFVTLVTTFAGVTGDIIVQAEIHELAFCLGAYLIYLLYKPKKSFVYFILLFLSLFCFLSAFKRIAIIAIVIALAFGYLLKFIARFHPKTASGLMTGLTVLVILLLVGYVALIKMDAFELLEKAGINTSGRVEIYQAVDEFYEFSPSFLGNGIGFLTYQLNTFMNVGVASVHNDFLQHFIDLGFWGYLIWLFSITLLRVRYFGKRGNVENGIVTFMLTLYIIIVSTTDNTMNYPLLTGVLAMLMMGEGFSEKVRHTETKLFGYVSAENAEEERETLL